MEKLFSGVIHISQEGDVVPSTTMIRQLSSNGEWYGSHHTLSSVHSHHGFGIPIKRRFPLSSQEGLGKGKKTMSM